MAGTYHLLQKTNLFLNMAILWLPWEMCCWLGSLLPQLWAQNWDGQCQLPAGSGCHSQAYSELATTSSDFSNMSVRPPSSSRFICSAPSRGRSTRFYQNSESQLLWKFTAKPPVSEALSLPTLEQAECFSSISIVHAFVLSSTHTLPISDWALYSVRAGTEVSWVDGCIDGCWVPSLLSSHLKIGSRRIHKS